YRHDRQRQCAGAPLSSAGRLAAPLRAQGTTAFGEDSLVGRGHPTYAATQAQDMRSGAMTEVVIVGAARTPVGAFNGGPSSGPACSLGQVAITEALQRPKVAPGEVSEIILGQILTAGTGQNPARQAAIGAGIPVEKTAYAINQLCGSGLRAVALGSQAI